MRSRLGSPWWRHQMETFSALLAISAGNSPVTGEFLTQRPVTRSFDVFFDLRLNKRLRKQSWGYWFETPSRPLWRHCNAVMQADTCGKPDLNLTVLSCLFGISSQAIDSSHAIPIFFSTISLSAILSHKLAGTYLLNVLNVVVHTRQTCLQPNDMADVAYHIEAGTKWPILCRRSGQTHFPERK